jgi:hypothetical protein
MLVARPIRSVTAAAAPSVTSGSKFGWTIRSIVPRLENPAASACLAQSSTSCGRTPGIVVGSPIPIFMRWLLS